MTVGEGEVRVRAQAKLNLTLEVGPRRSDGFHPVTSIMQTINLCDELVLRRHGKGLSLSCNDPHLPSGAGNLAYEAARLVLGRWVGPRAGDQLEPGVHVSLMKRIPWGAGLGGGSADAAAVLMGLPALLGLRVSGGELLRMAAALGSDVPFCLIGGTALVGGRGERVTVLPPLGPIWVVVAKPALSVSTAALYADFDRRPPEGRKTTVAMLQALREGSREEIGRLLANDLEPVAATRFREIQGLRDRMVGLGVWGAAMTGSGSAVFGLVPTRAHGEQVAGRLGQDLEGVWVVRAGNEDGLEIGGRGEKNDQRRGSGGS